MAQKAAALTAAWVALDTPAIDDRPGFFGPVLDRFSHGRRWAIGSTMAVRAFLCWVLASQVVEESLNSIAGE